MHMRFLLGVFFLFSLALADSPPWVTLAHASVRTARESFLLSLDCPRDAINHCYIWDNVVHGANVVRKGCLWSVRGNEWKNWDFESRSEAINAVVKGGYPTIDTFDGRSVPCQDRDAFVAALADEIAASALRHQARHGITCPVNKNT